MIEFGDKIYHIDFNAVDLLISSEKSLKAQTIVDKEIIETFDMEGDLIGREVITKKYKKPKEIDGSKYDLVKYMIDVVVDNNEAMDSTLGSARELDKMPLSYKIAFNTLLKYNILKEEETE